MPLHRPLRMPRGQFQTFFAKMLPTEAALEACTGAHH